MKKPIITLLFVVAAVITFGQQVAREEVLMELGTGTWCGYCPGAAMGAHDMISNGHDVAIIEYHSGSDPFATDESEARCDYYNITGFPTAFFDGTLSYVGGSATQSMYSNYLPLYNQRIVVPCSFTVDLCGDNVGSTYDVTITIEKVATYSGSNLKAHLCVTETGIEYSWQNQSTIDYCMRDMVPNDEGTSIDFSGGDVVEVDLSFTLDDTWETDSCELIAFVQDDDTKEVLQCMKVMVPDLMGCEPIPAMSCNDSSICEGDDTQFFDNTTGNEQSRIWNFEGGDPATSTDENPVVTYNTAGYFDVELIVTDGAGYYDTLLKEDWIEVKLDPTTCDKPEGTHHACSGQGQTYSTTPVPYATNYTWQVSPTNAGSINGNGATAIFNALEGYTGDFSIKVRAENECAIGDWSDTLAGVVEISPEVYELSPEGGYCPGTSGAELLLYGSETGVDYELFKDDETTGVTVAGTGDTISFGFFTEEGIYTSEGTNDYCNIPMTGMTWVHEEEMPGQPEQPEGPDSTCSNTDSQYYTNSGSHTTNLLWSIDPEEAGTVMETIADSVIIEWNIEYSGTATVTVAGENSCGIGEYSDPKETIINFTPVPEITGDSEVCEDEAYVYSTPENEGSTYEWTVTGGEIIEGAGTNQITVLWGDPGNGAINLTETSADNCTNNAEEFTTTIVICSGIDANIINQFKVYPNPATTELHVEFMLKTDNHYEVIVLNSLGQRVSYSEQEGVKGKQEFVINTAEMPEGYYMILVTTEKGLQFEDKFMKK